MYGFRATAEGLSHANAAWAKRLKRRRALTRARAGGGRCVNGDNANLDCTLSDLKIRSLVRLASSTRPSTALPNAGGAASQPMHSGPANEPGGENKKGGRDDGRPMLWLTVVSSGTDAKLQMFVANLLEVYSGGNWSSSAPA